MPSAAMVSGGVSVPLRVWLSVSLKMKAAALTHCSPVVGVGMFPEEIREMAEPTEWPTVMYQTYGVSGPQ